MISLKSTPLAITAAISIMACYTVALRASAERTAIGAARQRIAADLGEARLLRAELRTRSRLPELQRWNEQVLALAPPKAEQLVSEPVMLASFAVAAGGAPAAVPPANHLVHDAIAHSAPVPVEVAPAVAPTPASRVIEASFRKVTPP